MDLKKISIINSIKKELMKLEWWEDVQVDVKTQLEIVVNNIDVLGVLFLNTFMALFRWEHERRKITQTEQPNPLSGYVVALLGMRISEEAFQCGILPTRAVLGLYDFTDPNDSDVATCLYLCNQIEVLERIGVLKSLPKWQTSSEEVSDSIKVQKPKKPQPPTSSENIVLP